MTVLRPLPPSLFRSSGSLGLLLTLILLPKLALAQPDVDTDKIVFEPGPIPETEEEAKTLYSFNNSGEQPGFQENTNQGVSAADRLRIGETIDAYVDAVGDMELEEGPFSNDLFEDLFSAGRLAQQIEDHPRALDFFTRAMRISRINDGLNNLDQIPIMQAMEVSYKAGNQDSKVDEIQQGILEVYENIYGAGSAELTPYLLEYGVWNINAFLERSSILVNINRMDAGQFITDPQNYMSKNKNLRDTPLYYLYQSQQIFINALQILLQGRDYLNPTLPALESQLTKTYFLSIHRENILYQPDFFLTRKKSKTGSRLNTNAIELLESQEYRLGQESYERSLSYISNNENRTASQLAAIMLEAADWQLLFERKVKAAGEYEKVYEFFLQFPEFAQEAESLLYPEMPVVLPVFLPQPNSKEKLDISTEQPLRYFGYIDVSFQINRFGKAKRISVLGEGGEVTRNMEIRMQQYLQNVLFRPRFKEGKLDTDNFQLRYYLGI
jgi:hypothetical protein